MIFQLLSLVEHNELPAANLWLSGGESSFYAVINAKSKASFPDTILDIISGSEDFTFSDNFRESLISSWGYILSKEDPAGHSIPGTTQFMTWLNGYAADGRYGSKLENKSESIGVYKDAAALSPLNLTPYRLFDILNGRGIGTDDRVLFFSCLAALKQGLVLSDDIPNSPTNNLQVAALSSIGFAVVDRVSYQAKWVGYSSSALADRSWPVGSFITGHHPTFGSWRLGLDNLRVSNVNLLDSSYVGSVLSASALDSANWFGDKVLKYGSMFSNTLEAINAGSSVKDDD